MKTKANLLVLMCMLLISPALLAQTSTEKTRIKNMTLQERANHETDKMKRELSLTSDQEAKIREINMKYAQQRNNEVNKLKNQGKNSNTVLLETERENMKNIFMQQQNEKNNELRNVLTTSQYNMYMEHYNKSEKDKKNRNQAKMLIDFEF